LSSEKNQKKMKKIIVFLTVCLTILLSGNSFAQQSEQLVTVSGKSGGSISLSEIIGQQLLVSTNDQIVDSFTIIVGTGDQAVTIDVEGSFVTKKASNLMRTKPDGTPLKITNVIIKTSSGDFVKADDMSFSISGK